MSTKRKTGKGAGQPLRLSKARLDELVEEALVDAYGESEQVTGFYTMMENDLRLPFETEILGMTADKLSSTELGSIWEFLCSIQAS